MSPSWATITPEPEPPRLSLRRCRPTTVGLRRSTTSVTAREYASSRASSAGIAGIIVSEGDAAAGSSNMALMSGVGDRDGSGHYPGQRLPARRSGCDEGLEYGKRVTAGEDTGHESA